MDRQDLIRNQSRGGFPGGSVVKNLSASAGDMGSISGRTTKVPHATGQLSPQAATKTQGNQK